MLLFSNDQELLEYVKEVKLLEHGPFSITLVLLSNLTYQHS